MEKRNEEKSLRKRIRDGTIDSVEALKAEFKSAAKRTHPDLAGEGAGDEFLRLRRDYEAALRELTPPMPRDAATIGDRRSSEKASEAVPDRAAFAALELLLKRGFPKRPRQEKERLRYSYARIRARAALSALNDEAAGLFDEAERELLSLKDMGGPNFAAAHRLFREIVEAKLDGTPELIAAVRMELSRRVAPAAIGGERKEGEGHGPISKERPLGPATAAFLSLLTAP